MDTVEFDMMLFLFLKLRKKSSQKGIESKGFRQRKFLRNISFSLCFLTFLKMQGYFLKFSASDSSWLDRSGGFLILFSWLSFSEPISIYILLNPSLSPFMTEADII